MQNKPNLPDTQMNVSSSITMNYEHKTMNYAIKNKAKTNPIQSQFGGKLDECKYCLSRGL